MALRSLESEQGSVETVERGKGRTPLSCWHILTFPSPAVSAFHLVNSNSFVSGRREGLKRTVNSNPHTHCSTIPHVLTALLSPKYYSFSSNPTRIALLPSGPQPRLWLLSTWTREPVPTAQARRLMPPARVSGQAWVPSSCLQRTSVIQPVLNMETIFTKNQVHLQRKKIHHYQRYF